jgi:hypothetical protein
MTLHAATHHTAGHGLHRSSPVASLPPDRRGRLRNGAQPGDFLTAPRCGAHTRAGDCCRQPAMKNGRCRMHGGLSTGPRTAEGRARCAGTRRKHGFYSAEMVALRRAGAAHCRRMDAFFAGLRFRRTAGHGLLPPNLANRSGSPLRTLCVSASPRSILQRPGRAHRWAWAPSLKIDLPPQPPRRPSARRHVPPHPALRWAWGPSLLFVGRASSSGNDGPARPAVCRARRSLVISPHPPP